MKPQPPLKRSRTQQKAFNVLFEIYKPRDWDYQNPKHQIIPEFVLGKSKKRIPEPRHNYFPNDPTIYSPLNNGWRRELKPAIFRSYILSQASTVPGAVIVEENKIKDDKTKEERRKYVEKKNNELLDKLMNYDLNTDILSDLKKDDKKEINGKAVEKIKVNLKLTSPRKRNQRNNKLGEIKNNKN